MVGGSSPYGAQLQGGYASPCRSWAPKAKTPAFGRLNARSPEKCQLNLSVALLAYFHGLNIVPSCRMISDLLLYLVGPLSLFVAAALYLLGKRKP